MDDVVPSEAQHRAAEAFERAIPSLVASAVGRAVVERASVGLDDRAVVRARRSRRLRSRPCDPKTSTCRSGSGSPWLTTSSRNRASSALVGARKQLVAVGQDRSHLADAAATAHAQVVEHLVQLRERDVAAATAPCRRRARRVGHAGRGRCRRARVRPSRTGCRRRRCDVIRGPETTRARRGSARRGGRRPTTTTGGRSSKSRTPCSASALAPLAIASGPPDRTHAMISARCGDRGAGEAEHVLGDLDPATARRRGGRRSHV